MQLRRMQIGLLKMTGARHGKSRMMASGGDERRDASRICSQLHLPHRDSWRQTRLFVNQRLFRGMIDAIVSSPPSAGASHHWINKALPWCRLSQSVSIHFWHCQLHAGRESPIAQRQAKVCPTDAMTVQEAVSGPASGPSSRFIHDS